MKFTAEDFKYATARRVCEPTWEWAERVANARLAQMLAEAPVVYGTWESVNTPDMGWSELKCADDTHRARLVCIEEIEK